MGGVIRDTRPVKKYLEILLQYFLVAVFLGGIASSAYSQTADETRLNQLDNQITEIRNQITTQTALLDAARADTAQAKQDIYAAELELRTAQRERRYAQDRSISSMSASEYLSGTQSAISELRRRRSALDLSDTDAAAILDAQITALTRQVSEEAARYGQASNQRLSAMDAANRAVAVAEDKIQSHTVRLTAAQTNINTAQEQIDRLQATLGKLMEEMAEESDKVAPAWLSEIRVTQDGNLIYHASWATDGSVKQNIRDLIAEIDKERTELQRIRALVYADIETYSRESNAAYQQIKLLIDEQLTNDIAVIIGDKLYTFAEITLLFTTGAGVVQGVVTGLKTSGVLLSRAAMANAARGGARALVTGGSLGPLPNLLRWPEYATGAARALKLTSRVWSLEKALETTGTGWKIGAALVTTYQLGEGTYKIQQGTIFADTLEKRHNDPDLRRFETIMRQSVQQVANFSSQQLEFLVRHNLRRKYAMESQGLASRAYGEIQNKINDIENDFWHTILIGYITTPRAEIAGALDQAAITYMRSSWNGYSALMDLAIKEIEDIDTATAKMDTRLSELRAELAGPDVRKLTIHKNEKLTVRGAGVAEIALTFTQPLVDAPTAKIGAGPVVAYEINPNPGDGLPLPDIDGAVTAELTGQGTSWNGQFPLEPLQGFVDADDSLPIEINARDAAGRMLDANPRTAARRRPGLNNWSYNEPDQTTSTLGQGGADTWHELNATFEGGVSYAFVIDASGSMEDNNRMVQIKRSARSFLANMTDRDEVAVIAFFDCGNIQILQPFTRRHDLVIDVIETIVPSSGTPLAAAITRGGNYLLNSGHFEDKALIVLTDGEESCDGDPVGAAARFRAEANVMGDIANSESERAREAVETPPTPETPAEDEDESEDAVEAMPDDREAWTMTDSGGSNLPTISLVKMRFHEWRVGENCAAQVTRQTYHAFYGQAHYPGGTTRRGFGVNRRASNSETLDFAICSNGQAGMDAIRSRWASLNGTDHQTARAQAEARSVEILDQ